MNNSDPRSPDGQEQCCPNTSFQCIRPDEQKRQKLLEQHRKAEESFQRYKEERRVPYVSEKPAAVGGPSLPMDQYVNSLQYQQIRAPVKQKMKQREWKAEQRRREDAEIAAMKERQRQKAEALERKKEEKRKLEEMKNRQAAESARQQRLQYYGNWS